MKGGTKQEKQLLLEAGEGTLLICSWGPGSKKTCGTQSWPSLGTLQLAWAQHAPGVTASSAHATSRCFSRELGQVPPPSCKEPWPHPHPI